LTHSSGGVSSYSRLMIILSHGSILGIKFLLSDEIDDSNPHIEECVIAKHDA
jgi:hypothetical protein